MPHAADVLTQPYQEGDRLDPTLLARLHALAMDAREPEERRQKAVDRIAEIIGEPTGPLQEYVDLS